MENKKVQKIIDSIIKQATDVEIHSDVELDSEQKNLLKELNTYGVSQVMGNSEAARDPRKIPYMANQELKIALVAICLAQSLTSPNRKYLENKEYFEKNITVSKPDEKTKLISFGAINPENVRAAIYWDIIEDWKIFRDREGHGISSLIDEKTNLTGLQGYKKGGDMFYEFARFQRKYTEKERKKEEKARESAQNAFRNAMIQSVASKVAEQQLLEGKNPMEIVELLFAPSGNKREIKKLAGKSNEVDPQVENNIFLMLEDKSKGGSSNEK